MSHPDPPDPCSQAPDWRDAEGHVEDTDPDHIPSATPGRGVFAGIAVGGAVGSLGRWSIAEALPTRAGALPLGTAVMNICGALLLGALLVCCVQRRPGNRFVKPLLGVGVLGGFTTFSTVAVESRNLIAGGSMPLAVGYLVGSLVAGTLAASAGTLFARRFLIPRARRC